MNIFFIGHGDDTTPFSDTVDIFHLNLNDWSSIPLFLMKEKHMFLA